MNYHPFGALSGWIVGCQRYLARATSVNSGAVEAERLL